MNPMSCFYDQLQTELYKAPGHLFEVTDLSTVTSNPMTSDTVKQNNKKS